MGGKNDCNKHYSKKSGAQNFQKDIKEVIYGKNACFGCIAGYNYGQKRREIFEILILQNKFDEYFKKIPDKLKKIVRKCNNHDLFVLTHEQDKHQGIACRVSCFKFLNLDETLQCKTIGSMHTLFLLDRVQDPHNVGNIIRTAFCFGISGLILPDRDACGITPAVVRTSAGYSEHLPMFQVGNVANVLEKLKKIGYWIIGFDVNTNTSDDLSNIVEKYNNCVFIFGSEGNGMRDLTKKQCDILVRLPMSDGAESLNVANTATVVAWEVAKKRLKNQ